MGTAVDAGPAGARVEGKGAELEVSLLGALELRRDGVLLDLGTPKQRALVTALALSRGRPVSVDAIIELLWEDAPPAAATATLQAYVSGLRKVLEPGRERRTAATVLVTVAPGYALRLPPEAFDTVRFDRTVAEVHRLLALPLLGGTALSAGDLTAALERLDAALALWRGRPFAELEDAPSAVAERAHLEELRAVALEDRAVARLALGDHATTAAELEALTTAYPLRERLWALRALALVRSGRQADALDVLRQVRQVLDDELGLDPGAELRELQDKVLQQDPSLAWVPPAEPPVAQVEPPLAQAEPPLAQAEPPLAQAEPPPVEPPLAPPAAAGPGWPMLGRDAELAELLGVLDLARAGTSGFAAVTGEPGIGKSRLCREVADAAEQRGVRLLVGRCSQDDGAPPLWPWVQVLDQLGTGLPPADGEDAGSEFRTWERIVRVLRDATAQRPGLLVLDDLHWADTATLRVLRLLAETVTDAPLMVLATWRDKPRPEGALADVTESLARRHAVRVQLGGLDDRSVAGIVDAIAHRRPTPGQADLLRTRTDGNPFFLVEYARLAEQQSHTDLQRLLTEEHPPTAVQEVLGRRLARLPQDTMSVLRMAAVVGRDFDVPTLAAATGLDEDTLLDLVEVAQASGLVRDRGVDRFAFEHALVRDTVYAGLSPSRRARHHAKVAACLAGRNGRETEEARHWLAAGTAYAAQAWRTAVAAAAIARSRYAYPEAADLYAAALGALGDDPEATEKDRYDLLMELATAYRWAGCWPELTASVEQAVAVAEQIGDPVLVAQAAISTTRGALWQSAPTGEVHEGIVTALRRSLEALPDQDSALRCRCLLSLANELFYATSFAERRALIDEALAMARRLGDPELVMDACQVGFMAVWSPSTGEERLGFAEESLELARAAGDEPAVVVSATLRAVVLSELGRVEEMWEALAYARAEAERQAIWYGVMVVDCVAVPWHAMAGDFEECERLLEDLQKLAASASIHQSDEAIAGAMIDIGLWAGRAAEAGAMLREMEGGPIPVQALVAFLLWRGGDEDGARAYYAEHGVRLEREDWFSLLNWCHAAAVALYVEDAQLAAEVYARLAPHAGWSCSAGSGNATGPVDAYLAMAAAAVGELGLARRHADEAQRLAEQWRIPLFAQWLAEQRDRFGF